MKKTLALFVLCLTGAFAQDEPQYFLAAGTGFNHYAAPQASGFLTFGVRLGEGSYTYSTVTMTSKASSMSQGFMKVLIRQDGFTLAALGDAGVASGEGSVAGAFAGGGSLSYDISKWTRVPKTSAVAVVKILKAGGAEVQPVFCFGVSKAF